MGSSLSKRRHADEEGEDENRLVLLKKARFDEPENADVTVVMGDTEFQECSRFLRCWSGYFEDAFHEDPELKRFEFPEKKPEEWELVKAVLHPFREETVNRSNYHVLLPWFAELRCGDGLGRNDSVVLKDIVEPLLNKPEKERTPKDVQEIVTVLEHVVTWNREVVREKCLEFLRQVLKDPSQPYEGKELLRIVLLLTKDDACQTALWKIVKYYLPADLVEKSTFPMEQVKLVADNPLLLDVIEANKKLKKCLFCIELKLKRVVEDNESDRQKKVAQKKVAHRPKKISFDEAEGEKRMSVEAEGEKLDTNLEAEGEKLGTDIEAEGEKKPAAVETEKAKETGNVDDAILVDV